MHLLYLDESGHASDPQSDFFVLAGFSVFERQTHWLEAAMTPIAARFNAANPKEVEFHGAPMRGGKDDWRRFLPAERVQAVVDILALLANRQLQPRVFVSVIEKKLMAPEQILAKSFENLAVQFDAYLASFWQRKKQAERGLVIFDKTDYEQKLQSLSHLFKHEGHTNGRLRNFAEVPLFLDSKASRLIQLADMIAYWVFRYYQSGDDRGFKMIAPYIYSHGGVAHGYCKHISTETELRLTTLPDNAHPFPMPTPPPAQS